MYDNASQGHITLAAAAAIADESVATIRRRIRRGEIRAFRRGRAILVDRASVIAATRLVPLPTDGES